MQALKEWIKKHRVCPQCGQETDWEILTIPIKDLFIKAWTGRMIFGAPTAIKHKLRCKKCGYERTI